LRAGPLGAPPEGPLLKAPKVGMRSARATPRPHRTPRACAGAPARPTRSVRELCSATLNPRCRPRRNLPPRPVRNRSGKEQNVRRRARL